MDRLEDSNIILRPKAADAECTPQLTIATVKLLSTTVNQDHFGWKIASETVQTLTQKEFDFSKNRNDLQLDLLHAKLGKDTHFEKFLNTLIQLLIMQCGRSAMR